MGRFFCLFCHSESLSLLWSKGSNDWMIYIFIILFKLFWRLRFFIPVMNTSHLKSELCLKSYTISQSMYNKGRVLELSGWFCLVVWWCIFPERHLIPMFTVIFGLFYVKLQFSSKTHLNVVLFTVYLHTFQNKSGTKYQLEFGSKENPKCWTSHEAPLNKLWKKEFGTTNKRRKTETRHEEH